MQYNAATVQFVKASKKSVISFLRYLPEGSSKRRSGCPDETGLLIWVTVSIKKYSSCPISMCVGLFLDCWPRHGQRRNHFSDG